MSPEASIIAVIVVVLAVASLVAGFARGGNRQRRR